MENVSSACATQSFSEAQTEPGRQMPFLPTERGELAANFLEVVDLRRRHGLDGGAVLELLREGLEPPSVTQLERRPCRRPA